MSDDSYEMLVDFLTCFKLFSIKINGRVYSNVKCA